MTQNQGKTEALNADALRLGRGELPPGWEIVGSSVSARVAIHAADGIYYKEFLPRTPIERLKTLFRGSRATRARINNDILRAAGFNAPENIAWGKLPGGREYLFSASVPGQGVTRWLSEDLSQRQGEPLRLRRLLLAQLGVFIGRLHAAGFIHGDLRSSNVLAERDGDVFTFALIDNERNTHANPASGKDLQRNLMQLNMQHPGVISHTDRMRFFSQWRRQMTSLNDAEAKLLALESWKWAARRLAKKGLL
jgi:tRNA A-37 threonylcarbamoyl transferase component Bud32